MHRPLMYKLCQLVKCCLQENSTNFDKYLQIFPANAIATTGTSFTFIQDTFGSDPNPQFEILNFIFHFHILMIL